MSQSNLIKEAVADAKAIRATALANAKLALQEHFTEAITGALSEKLKTELQDDEESFEDIDSGEESEVSDISSVSLDVPVETDDSVAPVVPTEPVASELPVGEEPILQETEDPQGAKVKQVVIGNTPALKTSTPSVPSKQAAGEKTKDELGKTGQFKDQYTDGTSTLSESDESDDELSAIKDELENGTDDEEVVSENDISSVVPTTANQSVAPVDDDEVVNFDELMAEITTEPEAVADESEEFKNLQLENKNLKKQLSQFNESLAFVKTQLNEVNLLNAKLLYTNKLFAAGNLSNPQKLKIVESMDRTKNTREVKLVYSTIAESLNFGAKSATAPSQKVAVKTITEGLASKAVSSTKPTKEVITEGTEMANRFQKLAGIKKQVL